MWTSEFSKNDVHELARQTGPRTSFKASMSPRPLGDEEFYDDARSDYGYSSSDLTKIVNKAMAIAAQRVIRWSRSRILVEKTFEAAPEIMSPSHPDLVTAEATLATFYIHDATGEFATLDDTMVSLAELEARDAAELAQRQAAGEPEPDRFVKQVDRVLNFAVSWADFEAALREFPSNVSPNDYRQMIEWKNKRE